MAHNLKIVFENGEKVRYLPVKNEDGELLYFPIREIASRPRWINLTEENIKAHRQNPNECVVATYFRDLGIITYTIKDYTFLLEMNSKGTVEAVQYRHSGKLRKMIKDYDEGASFIPGKYELKVKTISQTYDVKSGRAKKKVKNPKGTIAKRGAYGMRNYVLPSFGTSNL